MKQLLWVGLLLTAGSLWAEDIKIKMPDYQLEIKDHEAFLCDAAGGRLLRMGKVMLAWSPPVADPRRAVKIDDRTVKIEYKIDKDDTGQVKLEATYRCLPQGVAVDYSLTAPAAVNVGGTMLELNPQNGVKKQNLPYKSGLWTHAANQGVPYEVKDGYFRIFTGKEVVVRQLLTGNPNFFNSYSEHLGFRKTAADQYAANTFFVISPSPKSDAEAVAAFHSRPLALSVTTDKNFNWFESGAPQFKVSLTDTANAALDNVELKVKVRDYDGKVVIDRGEKLKLAADERWQGTFELPDEERNLYFVEVSALLDGKGIVFCRTNIAKLPPFEYRHLSDSKIGMAAYFLLPDENEAFRLMRRLGVHHLRSGDNRKTLPRYGMVSYSHNNVSSKEEPAALKDKIDRMVADFSAQNSAGWEFGNEWNMNKKADEKRALANRYAELVRLARQSIADRKSELKLISMGIAGADTEFLQAIYDSGAWSELDGIAFHPGRGNMTADDTGSGWTYLGSIRQMKEKVAGLGGKPLYLTEVYAGTHPNDWWKDSYRQAAENTLLTFALGLVEGAASIQFYQLNDGVWHDVGGVDPGDGEYHYGLLMRDLSLKPSAMAFAAASEALDGAVFQSYFTVPGTKVNGLSFETPGGGLAILYNRADGFLQSKKSDDFAHPEPWVDHWRTVTSIELPSDQKEVVTVDVIGRHTVVPVVDGKVKLNVSGAPLMVYGLRR